MERFFVTDNAFTAVVRFIYTLCFVFSVIIYIIHT